MAKKKPVRDRHYLYTAAVQSVDADLGFFKRIYKRERGRRFERLREDFCGTAVLAHEWVRRDEKNHAWGVDLDRPTLAWGRERYGPRLDAKAGRRLHLMCDDVLNVTRPKVDVVAALNFSYSVFHAREQLGQYFRAVRRSMRPSALRRGSAIECSAERGRSHPSLQRGFRRSAGRRHTQA